MASSKKRTSNHTQPDNTINYAKIFDEKRKRVFTIAYRIYADRPTLNVEYAASVFRKDSEKEHYNRKAHLQTARGRLAVRPLYTTYEFSDSMLDALLERNVPKDREARRAWIHSTEGEVWRNMRRIIDESMSSFLLKEIFSHGVGSHNRLRRSEIQRRRTHEDVHSHNSTKEEHRDRDDGKIAELRRLLRIGNKNDIEHYVQSLESRDKTSHESHDKTSRRE